MTYLLDTHAFLWLAAAPEKLSPVVRKTVAQGTCELLLSAASGWEIALLWKLERIELPEPPAAFVPTAIQALGITPLPIGFTTAIAAATLPLLHRDPFDRLLVAEAMHSKLTILTKDETIPRYGVKALW
ncbi:MAG: type II toxin-antitoxin system VapC family toxin [Thermodesulfobacteriota bacterium]